MSSATQPSSSGGARLLASREGSTLVLTISNPRLRNAMNPSLYREGLAHVQAAAADSSVRAIVITGEGGHFCGGGDLHRLQAQRSLPQDEQRAHLDALGAWVQAIHAAPIPVIAAVEGAAAGGGFSLVLACDLIVAAEDARLVMSYIGVALSPDGGATASLASAMPTSLALELLWDAKPIAAARLQTLGVVNRVVAPGAALAEALAWADRLAQGPRTAQADIKRLVRSARGTDFRTQLVAEREAFVANLYGDDCGAAIERFLQGSAVPPKA